LLDALAAHIHGQPLPPYQSPPLNDAAETGSMDTPTLESHHLISRPSVETPALG
jgi:hypothetical protein